MAGISADGPGAGPGPGADSGPDCSAAREPISPAAVHGQAYHGLGRLSGSLALSTGGCVLLYVVRIGVSGRTSYTFMLWNLFLACVPFIIAALAVWIFSVPACSPKPPAGRRAALIPVLLLWLLFFPNAPYILTDFIHIVNKTYIKNQTADLLGKEGFLWYDLVMTAAFAFVGHLAGLISLWLMHRLAVRYWGSFAGRCWTLAAIALSGFGIYLGRFARFNSWDIFSSPAIVVSAVKEISRDSHAIIISFAFSLVVFLSYIALDAFHKMDSD